MSNSTRAVFLSYASQDSAAARKIGEALRQAGVEVWLDQSALRGGDAWDAKIRAQIKACALFVPLISRHTQERLEGYFRLEWNLAERRMQHMHEDAAFLLPVVIDSTVEENPRVPEKFFDVQWTRLPGGEPTPAFGKRVTALLGCDVAKADPFSRTQIANDAAKPDGFRVGRTVLGEPPLVTARRGRLALPFNCIDPAKGKVTGSPPAPPPVQPRIHSAASENHRQDAGATFRTNPVTNRDKILIIEDDPTMQRVLKDNFEFRGYEVRIAPDGRKGVQAVFDFKPDLILLDIMLPEVNGFDVCRRIRKEGLAIPIIMLTAKSQESDIVLGLNLGADDYVAKPFSLDVLLARAQACLRRRRAPPAEVLEFGECQLDTRSHKLFRNGSEIVLTPKEFRLLEYFARNTGRAFTRQKILDEVWGEDLIVTERSVDRCINTLRNKVETDPQHPRFIQTIRDVGYRFEVA